MRFATAVAPTDESRGPVDYPPGLARIRCMAREVTAPFDVEPYLGVLRRYALVLTRDSDEAEDLVQDALVRAIAAAGSWRPGSDLKPWLLSIVHNTHVSRQRRRQV